MHNQVRVDDAEGRSQLARHMLRAPMALEKMTYDAPLTYGPVPDIA